MKLPPLCRIARATLRWPNACLKYASGESVPGSASYPSDDLRIRLAKLGVPGEEQERTALWNRLATRWIIPDTAVPASISVDDIARLIIRMLERAAQDTPL